MSMLKLGNKGATVVETVIIVTLLCVVAILFLPRLSMLIAPQSSLGYCMQIKTMAESMQQRSAATGMPYMLIVDLDNNNVWGLQTSIMPKHNETPALGRSAAIENIYDTILHFGPNFNFVDIELPQGREIFGLVGLRFDNGMNENALIHIRSEGADYTIWLQPFSAQVHIFKGHFNFATIYTQKY